MFLRRRLCVTEKWIKEHGYQPCFAAASLSWRHPPPGLYWKAEGSWKGHGAGTDVSGLWSQAEGQQTAGEPRTLWAGHTNADLRDAFVPSIFKKEHGKKILKSSEPFLIFQLCEKEYYPLETMLNSRVFLWGRAMQRHVPVVDPCGRSVCCRNTRGSCSLFQLCDNGWRNSSQFFSAVPETSSTSGHRNDTKPA